ncbi:MAG: glycosyltransferase [Pseudonocardia sp.]|nr:glycosyltransferase [Pseudonocardia sp.]
MPHVSVCIPVYNGERFLAETMRSVLDQSYRDFELVVLDNASTDATGEIARSFGDPRVRVAANATTIFQPENWRAAVRLCRGPLIKLLCADDLLHPRCLEYQVGPMETDPGIALVAARRHMIDEKSRILVPRRGLAGLTGLRTSVEVARRVVRSGANPIGEPGGALFRRAHYEAVGGWHPERRHAMDLDLWMRLLHHGEFLGLPETLAAFRVAQQSLSVDNEAGVYEHQRAIMAELAASPHLQIRQVDATVGRVLAPTGRLRRRVLFGMSKHAARRDERSTDLAGLGQVRSRTGERIRRSAPRLRPLPRRSPVVADRARHEHEAGQLLQRPADPGVGEEVDDALLLDDGSDETPPPQARQVVGQLPATDTQ